MHVDLNPAVVPSKVAGTATQLADGEAEVEVEIGIDLDDGVEIGDGDDVGEGDEIGEGDEVGDEAGDEAGEGDEIGVGDGDEAGKVLDMAVSATMMRVSRTRGEAKLRTQKGYSRARGAGRRGRRA